MSSKNAIKNNIILKIIVIGFLIIVLLIPTIMIRGLINEREQRRDSAISEVSSKWGEKQTLAGPILTVPYKKFIKEEEDKVVEQVEYAHFLPNELKITGNIKPEMLRRGIYEIVAYNTNLKFEGKFTTPDFRNFNISEENVILQDAIISIGIPDTRGINENIIIKWNDRELQAKPGLGIELISGPGFYVDEKTGDAVSEKYIPVKDIKSGVSVKVPLNVLTNIKETYSYSFDINLNGSRELNFLPLGSETDIELASSWQTPSFDGAFLPDEREVNQNGFKAEWRVLQLNRNFPQSWLGKLSSDILDSAFGVKLLIPVDEYQKSMRSVKYAIMVISLTFLIFFFVEVMNKIRIHPIQYILVGLALILFFSLLLSLSEHINFNLAYLIASIATILMIALYTKNIFKNNKLTILQSGILVVIYTFIFIILQLQDYSLLIGSIGLFAVLAIVMFVSRKIDWYEIGSKDISEIRK